MTLKPKTNTLRTSFLHAPAGLFKSTARIAAACALICLAACSTLAPAERRESALQLAAGAAWQTTPIAAGRFQLLSLHPTPIPVHELAVFIEGDGYAWVDPRTPSADPTPNDPIALRLALAENRIKGGRTGAYLARPCQFDPSGSPQNCRTADWTQARFSDDAVTAMNVAVGRLKQMFFAERLVLVGYSGGGAMAALLAARRDDVVLLVTVAGVLDHE
eukprot:gene7573-9388_t